MLQAPQGKTFSMKGASRHASLLLSRARNPHINVIPAEAGIHASCSNHYVSGSRRQHADRTSGEAPEAAHARIKPQASRRAQEALDDTPDVVDGIGLCQPRHRTQVLRQHQHVGVTGREDERYAPRQ